MKEKLSVTAIFPMAGRGTGFGYKFKPFITVEDATFIQRAVSSFDKCFHHIKETIFIFLEEQEREFNVSQRLKEIFPLLNYRTVILDAPTSGPAETVRKAIEKDGRIKGEIIICDCDHYVDVEPLFNYLLEGNNESCIVPVWNLRGEDIKGWSVAALSDEGHISSIAEKELPKSPGGFFGVIGCYYFNDASLVMNNKRYISEIIQDLINKNEKIKGIKVFKAEFFGDPERLQKTLNIRKKQKGTIFCGLDGTLIDHEDNPSYEGSLKIIPGVLEKLKKWSEEGYHLILATSRKSEQEKELVKALKEANIIYDRLITGIPSGPRFLINDRKPSDMLTPQAMAFEIERNKGLSELEIDSTKPNILKMFKGGSLSKTLLIENSGKLFVRKVISKDKSMSSKYLKLKQQCNDLKRLSKLCREVIPKIYKEEENSFEYYYDMEFFPDHDLLVNYSNVEKLKAVKLLLKKMSNSVYKHGALLSNSGNVWLINHFSDKIYPKIAEDKLPQKLFYLVNSDRVSIEGKEYSGLSLLLKKSLEQPYISHLSPNYLSPIHGDLTFENILYKTSTYNLATNSYEPSIKLIDTDGIDFVDPPELDLGKMFQSIISQYDLWSLKKDTLVKIDEFGNIALNFKPDLSLLNDAGEYVNAWSEIINGDLKDIMIKGHFYMGLHLIRMIPFRLAVSEDQALFALISAIKAITYSLNLIREKREINSSSKQQDSYPSDSFENDSNYK